MRRALRLAVILAPLPAGVLIGLAWSNAMALAAYIEDVRAERGTDRG